MLAATLLATVVPNILVVPPDLIARPRAVLLALDEDSAAVAAENGRTGSRVGSAAPVKVC